jgi:ferrous iron transport protein B
MSSCCGGENRLSPGRPRAVLIGNPNVGKSVIFNYLTGKYVVVSNYPGTTVEITKGTLTTARGEYEVVDTPGINSLIPLSEDEKVTRDILLSERPAWLIQVIDAKNLRRGLSISLQLMEMGFPFLVVLNMWDEAKSRGIEISREALSRLLGVPVLHTVATKRKGLDRIPEATEIPLPNGPAFSYPDVIEAGISAIGPLLPEIPFSSRSLALMLLAGDESLTGWLHAHLAEETIARIEAIRQETQSRFTDPLGYLINQARLGRVDALLPEVVRQESKTGRSPAAVVGNLAIHPLWGIPILLLVLTATYLFVGVFGAQIAVDFLQKTFFEKWTLPPLTGAVERLLPGGFFREVLVGPYGFFTMALTYAVAIVLPIVGCFFLVFGLMEDSGYLPRLAVMSNQVFKRMGLNGKAILPMILGLGCGTMATLTTRILDTKKDRLIVTFLLALGVPCSAQLGVTLGMFSSLPAVYFLIWITTMVAVLLASGYVASRVVPGESSDFILEIPPLRMPQLSNVAVKTLARVEWYLKEAVPLFILGTLFLFLLHETKGLALLERLISPVFDHFLGLPARTAEAFIVGFLRRDYGAAGLYAMARAGELTAHQIVVSLVTMTLFIPCIAQFFMMIKERGLRPALTITAIVFPSAFGLGGLIHFLLKTIGM